MFICRNLHQRGPDHQQHGRGGQLRARHLPHSLPAEETEVPSLC